MTNIVLCSETLLSAWSCIHVKHSGDLALSPLAIAAAVSMLSYVRVLLHAPAELPNLVFVIVLLCLVFVIMLFFGKNIM